MWGLKNPNSSFDFGVTGDSRKTSTIRVAVRHRGWKTEFATDTERVKGENGDMKIYYTFKKFGKGRKGSVKLCHRCTSASPGSILILGSPW